MLDKIKDYRGIGQQTAFVGIWLLGFVEIEVKTMKEKKI